MATVQYVCLFVRAAGDRLRAPERLTLALPQLLGGALQEVEFRYQSSAQLLGVFVRLQGDGLAQARLDRLVFWTARAGGRALAMDDMTSDDRARVEAYLARPTQTQTGVSSAALFEDAGRFFTELGAPPERRRSPTETPVLVMDMGGPGWHGVRWHPESARLFVAAPLAPPVGDAVHLLVRVPGAGHPIEAWASVAEVVLPAEAGPGAPAGYTLQLESPPPSLLEALASSAPAGEHDARATPRFPVSAPVKVTRPLELQLEDEPGPPARVPSAPVPAPAAGPAAQHALIEYATDQELAADFVENLSQGGAFVRTSSPSAVGTALELEVKLPNGTQLHARATVAFTKPNGMGVRFQLAPEAEAVLASAIAHISARPRRALVVDDDQTICRMMADALHERGFEVLTAANASEGLAMLSEELLALDLLVTDHMMPGMSGEEFVKLIRRAGGESELAIVCVSGQVGGDGLEQRLEAAGADAVLEKSLGPELIAQAADAVLERKRLLAPSP